MTIAAILKAFPKKKKRKKNASSLSFHLYPLPPRWSMGVNQGLALAQIGNEHPRARKNNYDQAAAKMDSSIGSPSLCSSSPGRWGPAMGSNYRWMPADSPVPAARAIGPRPRAFSRQIASSALKSNLLRTAGFCQRNRRFPFVPRDGAVGRGWIQTADNKGVLILRLKPLNLSGDQPSEAFARVVRRKRRRKGREMKQMAGVPNWKNKSTDVKETVCSKLLTSLLNILSAQVRKVHSH